MYLLLNTKYSINNQLLVNLTSVFFPHFFFFCPALQYPVKQKPLMLEFAVDLKSPVFLREGLKMRKCELTLLPNLTLNRGTAWCSCQSEQ